LAELLDRARRGAARSVPGDLEPGDRTAEPAPAARYAALAASAGALLAASWSSARVIGRRRRARTGPGG
ncbi:MAG TPA: hypothetical protein VFU35_12365, partial [Jatrophihabitans sp.]|nr:hypothetical protein [Jatrophihabitans sp.]